MKACGVALAIVVNAVSSWLGGVQTAVGADDTSGNRTAVMKRAGGQLREVGITLDGQSAVPRPILRTILRNAGHGGAEEFPDVVKLSNGDVFCVFYEGYAHVSTPNERFPTGGRIMAIRSQDDGRTWSDPVTVADTAWDDRDPSVVEVSPGRLVSNFFAVFRPASNDDTLGLFLVESDDGGHTWTKPRRLRPNLLGPHARALACSSPIRKLSDSSLILPAYYERGPKACGVTARSTDGGRTWVDWALVGREKASLHVDAETDIVELRDGSLYAVLRRSRHCGYWAISRDKGKSWGPARPLAFPANWPYMLRTREGILLLDSGGRMSPDAPYTGNVLRYSTDEGRTWSAPTTIDASGGGYASMAELDDGTILYIHYAGEPGDLRQTYFRVHRGNDDIPIRLRFLGDIGRSASRPGTAFASGIAETDEAGRRL